MQIHQIKRKTKNSKKKVIGRGGKRGTFSGRGTKGQKARAGRKMRPELRDIIKKIPKKRGYKFNTRKVKPTGVNLNVLETKFNAGEAVNPKTLIEKGVITLVKGRTPAIKLLASGSITKALLVSECQISNEAKSKIEKAGGKVS